MLWLLQRPIHPFENGLGGIVMAFAEVGRFGHPAILAVVHGRHRVRRLAQSHFGSIRRAYGQLAVVVGQLRGHLRRHRFVLFAGNDENALAGQIGRIVDQPLGRKLAGVADQCRHIGAVRRHAAKIMSRIESARALGGRSQWTALAAKIRASGHDARTLDDRRIDHLKLHRHEGPGRKARNRGFADVDIQRRQLLRLCRPGAVQGRHEENQEKHEVLQTSGERLRHGVHLLNSR